MRLRNLLVKCGSSLWTDARRCEALIHDLCGAKTKEANRLIQALKQQVPAELLAMPKGASPVAALERMRKRLEDNGMTEAAARWAVKCWAIALGVLADTGPEVANHPKRQSPSSPPKMEADGKVTHAQIAADLQRYVGRTVQVIGKYQYILPTYLIIEDVDGRQLEVYYTDVPPEQQQGIIKNDRKLYGKPTTVEGRVEQVRENDFAIRATKILIKGRRPTSRSD